MHRVGGGGGEEEFLANLRSCCDFQIYDRIATRIPSPCRAPQTDAVQRAHEVEELLRGAERSSSRNIDRGDLRELQELLVQPHFKVSAF